MKAGHKIRDYVLKAQIGAGGVGEVWRAYHEPLKKPVAIKLILSHLCKNENIYKRFVQEAIVMANLEHPHIVTVHDFFFDADNACIVMSYIEGGSLEDRLQSDTPLSLSEALHISQDILDALDFAHQRGVFHRDVKPSNILLTSDLNAYLTDFGIALVLGKTRVTKFGTNIGTPEYMSPEQIRGEELDHQTDVYSFGCVLYEMLGGRPPFGNTDEEGVTDFTIMERHIKEPPESLRKLNSAVNAQTEAVVMRALLKNRNDRPAGCAEMAKALVPADIREHQPSPASVKMLRILKAVVAVLALSSLISAVGWISTSKETKDLKSDITLLDRKNAALEQKNQELVGNNEELQLNLARINSLEQENEKLSIQIKKLKKQLVPVKPITIRDIKLYNSDRKGNLIGRYTDTFRLSEIEYLSFRIKIRNRARHKGKLGVKHILPNGKVTRGLDTSAPEFTLSIDVTPNKTEYFRGWGNKNINIFPTGRHMIEFWFKGKKVAEKAFTVK